MDSGTRSLTTSVPKKLDAMLEQHHERFLQALADKARDGVLSLDDATEAAAFATAQQPAFRREALRLLDDAAARLTTDR